MKIVIVGAGKVGFTLAQRLTQENHDVIVIEKDESRRAIIESNLDVMTICGNGASPKILADAGIDDVSMIIAVTDSDEVNMIACIAAKQAGVEKAIARVRNTEYLDHERLAFHGTLGIDLVINPEMITALEISQILRTPAALNVEDFASGRVRILEVKIKDTSHFAGMPLSQLTLPDNILITGIMRKDRVIIPHGNDILAARDNVFFLGAKESIHELEEQFAQKRSPIQRVVLVGAGRIGKYLAAMLENSGISVKVIEKDRRRCEELAKISNKTMVLCGDGSDIELMAEEGVGESDAVICLTDDDKLNLLIALLAKHLGAQKTFVRVGRPEYMSLFEQVGVDVSLSPRLLTAGAILRQVRRGDIVSIAMLEGAKAEAIEISVTNQCKILGKRFRDVKFPKNALVGAIVREDHTLIPNGDSMLKVDDRAIIFTLPEVAVHVIDFLEGR